MLVEETITEVASVTQVTTVTTEEAVAQVRTVKEIPGPTNYLPKIAVCIGILTHYFRGLHWLDKINLETLDMGDPYKCIIGQIFGQQREDGWGYIPDSAPRWLDTEGIFMDCTTHYPTKFGLEVGHGSNRTNEYKVLQSQWLQVLTPLKVERDAKALKQK